MLIQFWLHVDNYIQALGSPMNSCSEWNFFFSQAMNTLRSKPMIIFYLKLRHNNLAKLPSYIFLGLDIRHLTVHNSSLAVIEDSSLSSIGKFTFKHVSVERCALRLMKTLSAMLLTLQQLPVLSEQWKAECRQAYRRGQWPHGCNIFSCRVNQLVLETSEWPSNRPEILHIISKYYTRQTTAHSI